MGEDGELLEGMEMEMGIANAAQSRAAPEVRLLLLTQREFFIDNLLVRIHFIIEMIWWSGLAPLI